MGEYSSRDEAEEDASWAAYYKPVDSVVVFSVCCVFTVSRLAFLRCVRGGRELEWIWSVAFESRSLVKRGFLQ